MARSSLIIAITACVLLATAGTSLSAGFEVAEQSGRLLGSAYAGKAAEASDASTVFFNPAGLMRLEGYQTAISAHVLWTTGHFEDDGSASATGAGLGNLNGGNAGGTSFIPATFVAIRITDDIAAGFGINAPFGLTTEYDDGWKGRYHALESHLETMNFNPSVAYRIPVLEGMFSIGVGFNLQRAEAKLTKTVDYGSIAFGALGAPTATALGFSPQGNDGEVKISGDSWGYGFNAGVLVELDERTRIGLAYRSKIEHTLDGKGKFEHDIPPEAKVLQGGGAFVDSDVEADVTLPDQVSLSAYHEICAEWTLLADVTWTRWSEFDELRIEFDNPAQGDSVTEENWNDVFRYALGAIWRPKADESMTMRFGVAYDESPISDKYRTARIPTNDRIWTTIGIGYKFSDYVAFDMSYMRVWISDADIDERAEGTGQRLKGTYEGNADVWAISLSIEF